MSLDFTLYLRLPLSWNQSLGAVVSFRCSAERQSRRSTAQTEAGSCPAHLRAVSPLPITAWKRGWSNNTSGPGQPRELLPSDEATQGPSQAHSQDWAMQLTALQPRRGRQTSGPQRLLRWLGFLPCDTERCNSKRPGQRPHPPPSPAEEKTVSTGHPQRDSGKHRRTQTKTHGHANNTYINRRSLPDANNGVFREP